jgi:hypothetical protein
LVLAGADVDVDEDEEDYPNMVRVCLTIFSAVSSPLPRQHYQSRRMLLLDDLVLERENADEEDRRESSLQDDDYPNMDRGSWMIYIQESNPLHQQHYQSRLLLPVDDLVLEREDRRKQVMLPNHD